MLLGELRQSSTDGVNRLSTEIQGKDLWFESADLPLFPRAEAIASAMIFAAISKGRRLELSEPVAGEWLKGIRQLLPIWGKWWGYPQLEPEASIEPPNASPGSRGRALCFTSGVDSFHSLLRGGHKLTHLLYVEGYDIRLDEPERLRRQRKSLREVADACGLKPLVVRTNLRDHPSFKGVNWEHAHGSALAAAGYLISSEVGELIIPSSYLHDLNHPWGSSSYTDHYWSTPFFQVSHGDASAYRYDKIRALKHEPLPQQHLRVCFKRGISTLNCSACEKCVRTMIALQSLNALERFKTLDPGESLAKRVDDLPCLPENLGTAYRNFLDREMDAELQEAIRRLLHRRPAKPLRRVRALARKLFRQG